MNRRIKLHTFLALACGGKHSSLITRKQAPPAPGKTLGYNGNENLIGKLFQSKTKIGHRVKILIIQLPPPPTTNFSTFSLFRFSLIIQHPASPDGPDLLCGRITLVRETDVVFVGWFRLAGQGLTLTRNLPYVTHRTQQNILWTLAPSCIHAVLMHGFRRYSRRAGRPPEVARKCGDAGATGCRRCRCT